jgi:hypothetical protein
MIFKAHKAHFLKQIINLYQLIKKPRNLKI